MCRPVRHHFDDAKTSIGQLGSESERIVSLRVRSMPSDSDPNSAGRGDARRSRASATLCVQFLCSPLRQSLSANVLVEDEKQPQANDTRRQIGGFFHHLVPNGLARGVQTSTFDA